MYRLTLSLLLLAPAGLPPSVLAQGGEGKKSKPADRVDLRPLFNKFGLAPRDQGTRDTCSLFAVTALAEFETSRARKKGVRLSEEFLIWAANEATGQAGDQAMFYEALHGLRVLGISTEAACPYKGRPEAKRRPTDAALADARGRRGWAVHWIKRWNVKRGLTDEELLAIQAALTDGHPVAVGMRWPKALRLDGGVMQMPRSSEEVFDGHSVALVGYQKGEKYPGGGRFLLRNSAGQNWGLAGHAFITFAQVRAYTNDAVWIEPTATAGPAPERFEAEALAVRQAVRCRTSPQEMSDWGGKLWGGERQLFCGAQDGGWVELTFTVKKAGRYRVSLYATMAPDFGRMQPALDGATAGKTIDLYSPRVMPTGEMSLGVFTLRAGAHLARFTAKGKNILSSGHAFGLDALELTPVSELK